MGIFGSISNGTIFGSRIQRVAPEPLGAPETEVVHEETAQQEPVAEVNAEVNEPTEVRRRGRPRGSRDRGPRQKRAMGDFAGRLEVRPSQHPKSEG